MHLARLHYSEVIPAPHYLTSPFCPLVDDVLRPLIFIKFEGQIQSRRHKEKVPSDPEARKAFFACHYRHRRRIYVHTLGELCTAYRWCIHEYVHNLFAAPASGYKRRASQRINIRWRSQYWKVHARRELFYGNIEFISLHRWLGEAQRHSYDTLLKKKSIPVRKNKNKKNINKKYLYLIIDSHR
jgi:hypothetical protein